MNSYINFGILVSVVAYGCGVKPIYLTDASMCQLATQIQVFYLSFLGFLRVASLVHFYFLFTSMISQTNCHCPNSCFLPMHDAKCFMSISSRADCLSLQVDLSSLADWSSTWKLTFNEKKCSVVHFTRGQSSVILSYSISDTIISSVGSQKDLGVILSADMQWRSHYLFIIARAYKMLGLIRRVFSSVRDVYPKRCLYLSLIRSQLLYCSPLWRPQLLVDVRSLETVQRRATKFINPSWITATGSLG